MVHAPSDFKSNQLPHAIELCGNFLFNILLHTLNVCCTLQYIGPLKIKVLTLTALINDDYSTVQFSVIV